MLTLQISQLLVKKCVFHNLTHNLCLTSDFLVYKTGGEVLKAVSSPTIAPKNASVGRVSMVFDNGQYYIHYLIYQKFNLSHCHTDDEVLRADGIMAWWYSGIRERWAFIRLTLTEAQQNQQKHCRLTNRCQTYMFLFLFYVLECKT